MSNHLYVRVGWRIDQFGFKWCQATMVLYGEDVVTRESRLDKSGDMMDADIVRRTAISLCKHEFCRTINDVREWHPTGAETV